MKIMAPLVFDEESEFDELKEKAQKRLRQQPITNNQSIEARKDGKKKDKRPNTAPAIRILPAKELRKRAFLCGPQNIPPNGMPHELVPAKPGKEKTPLLNDSIVECGHCGFPVWTEHAEPADEDTFRRLKIHQRNQRYLDEPEAEQSEDDDEKAKEEDLDKEGSENMSDMSTVDRLEMELEKLTAKYEKLEADYDKLEEEKDQIVQERDELKQKLTASEEKCEFLQASEFRWREKFTNLKLEMEERERAAEAKDMNIADREFRILRLRAQNGQLSLEIDEIKKKQSEVYDGLAGMGLDDDLKELMILQMKAWRQFTIIQQLDKEAMLSQGELHEKLQATKAELAEERIRRVAAEETTERHKIRRWQVGRTKLVRVHLATKLWRLRILWRQWLAVHPIMVVQNRLSEADLRYDNLQEKFRAKREQSAMEVADILTRVEDNAIHQGRQREVIGSLNEDLLASDIRAREIREAEAKAASELLVQTTQTLQEEAEERMTAAQTAWAEEKHKLNEHIELLYASLPMDAEGKKLNAKVVAQSKGVVCVSCCKQLVHHNVMPLPPKNVDLPGASEGIGAPDVGFFAKELHSLLKAKKEDFGGYPGSVPGPMPQLARPSSSPSLSRVPGARIAGRPGTAGGTGNEALRREVAVGAMLPGRPPGVGSRALRSEVNALRQHGTAITAWR